MRVKGCWVMLMALVCVPLLSHAAEVKLTSSTQFLWYQDLLADQGEREAAQYLRFNVTKIDKEGKLNIYGYGRATKQITTSQDPQGRLYYFYADYRDAFQEHLDVRAGRTYVNAAAASGTIDGAHVDLKNLGPLGMTVFGGRHVIFDDKREVGTRGDALMGTSVYLDTIKSTHVEVSYGRRYSDSDLARELLGLDFTTTPLGMANFYGRLKYDMTAETYNELLFGAKVSPFRELVLRAEYYESYPTFDIASIYSVFAVDQYKEKSIAAEYQVHKDYRVSVKYARENYGESASGDLFHVGLLARPVKDLTVNASYEQRNGFAGQLSGFRVYGQYKIMKAAVSAGVDYDDFRREASREGSARKYWAGVEYEFSKMLSAILRMEDNTNFTYDHSYQGYAAIQINY